MKIGLCGSCLPQKHLLKQKNRPSAILAGNDQMAFGAIGAARELGLSVPDDLAVVGFDDVPLSAYFEPPLTTVRIPRYRLGEGTMEMLIDLIREEEFNRIRWFKTDLIVRDFLHLQKGVDMSREKSNLGMKAPLP